MSNFVRSFCESAAKLEAQDVDIDSVVVTGKVKLRFRKEDLLGTISIGRAVVGSYDLHIGCAPTEKRFTAEHHPDNNTEAEEKA